MNGEFDFLGGMILGAIVVGIIVSVLWMCHPACSLDGSWNVTTAQGFSIQGQPIIKSDIIVVYISDSQSVVFPKGMVVKMERVK